MLVAQLFDAGADSILGGLVFRGGHADEFRYFYHIVFLHAAAGNSGSTDSQTACDKWALRIVRNGVLIGCDANFVQSVFQLFSGQVEFPEVKQHQMVVGAAGYNVKAFFNQAFRKYLRIFYDLFLVFLKFV